MRRTTNEPFLDQDTGRASLPMIDFDDDDVPIPQTPDVTANNPAVPVLDFEDDFEPGLSTVPASEVPDFTIDYLLGMSTQTNEDDFSLELDDFDINLQTQEGVRESVPLQEAMEVVQKQLDVLEKDERKFLISEDMELKSEDLTKAVIERIEGYPDFKVDPTYRKSIGTAIVKSELDSSQALKFFDEDPALKVKVTNNDLALKEKSREFIISTCESLKSFITVGRNSKSEYRNANLKLFKTLFSDLIYETKEIEEILMNYESAFIRRVKRIVLGSGKYSFVCGNCDQINTIQGKNSPVTLLVREKTDSGDSTFYSIMGKMVCQSCGELNLIGRESLKMINDQLSLKMGSVIEGWISNNRAITSLKKVFVWDAPNDLVSDILPDIFSSTVEDTRKEDASSTRDLSGVMRKWYNETLSALRTVKSRKFIKIGASSDYTDSISDSNYLDSMKDLTYLFCEKFSLDYNTVFEYALSALMLHLEENPSLLSQINFDSLCMDESSSLLINYFETDVSDEDKLGYAREIAKSIALPEADKLSDIDFVKSVTDRLNFYRDSYIRQKGHYDNGTVLNGLNRTASLYRFIPIANKKLDLERYMGVLVNERTRNVLYAITNQIILYNISDQIISWVVSRHKSGQIQGIKTLNVLADTHSEHSKFSEKVRGVISESVLVGGTKGNTASLETIVGLTTMVSLVNLTSVADVDNIFQDLISSVENKDYYLFNKSVLYLSNEEGQRNLVSPLSAIPELYTEIFGILNEYKEAAVNFFGDGSLNVSDSELLNYYFYHYGNQFSLEEIKGGLEKTTTLWKPFYTLKREEGESFSSYLKRMTSPRSKEDKFILPVDYDKFGPISSRVVPIYGISLFYSKAVKNLKKIRTNSLIVDMINAFYRMGPKAMYYLLGLERNVPDDLSMDEAIKISLVDEEARRMRIVLDNFIYLLDGDLNNPSSDTEEGSENVSYSSLVYAEPTVAVPYLDLLGEVGDMLRVNFGL